MVFTAWCAAIKDIEQQKKSQTKKKTPQGLLLVDDDGEKSLVMSLTTLRLCFSMKAL